MAIIEKNNFSNRLCKCLSKIAHCPSRKFRSLALASQCRSLSRLCVRSAARSRVWSPLPARTRLDRTLDWLLHTLAPRPPGRPESSHRCFARSFFSLFLPLDSEQWHGIHGVASSSCSCVQPPRWLPACTYVCMGMADRHAKLSTKSCRSSKHAMHEERLPVNRATEPCGGEIPRRCYDPKKST